MGSGLLVHHAEQAPGFLQLLSRFLAVEVQAGDLRVQTKGNELFDGSGKLWDLSTCHRCPKLEEGGCGLGITNLARATPTRRGFTHLTDALQGWFAAFPTIGEGSRLPGSGGSWQVWVRMWKGLRGFRVASCAWHHGRRRRRRGTTEGCCSSSRGRGGRGRALLQLVMLLLLMLLRLLLLLVMMLLLLLSLLLVAPLCLLLLVLH
mmetsp:Transcript_95109/g.207989  ORF Transcript_95109/g.207989 Transcript_95109/m.207989 type:complete len:205 (-) Transcript_95109:661-1275(-)